MSEAGGLIDRVNEIHGVFMGAESGCWQTQWRGIVDVVPKMKRFIEWGQNQGGHFPTQKKGYFTEHGEGRFFRMSYSTFLLWERVAFHKALQEMADQGALNSRIIKEPQYITDEKKAKQGE